MGDGHQLKYYNTLRDLYAKEEVGVYHTKNSVICSQEIVVNKDGKEVPSRRYFWILAKVLQSFLRRTEKENRNFHEVCRDGFPQKFFIDIDYEFRSVKYAENFNAQIFLKPYINLIRQFFINDRERSLMKDKLRGIIFQSVSKDNKKISFHIIITGIYFEDVRYHKIFVDHILKHFDAERKRVNPKLASKVYTECHIDKQIYKKTFSLRLPGCAKKGKGELRIKKFYAWFNISDGELRSKTYDGLFLDSLLTYVENCERYEILENSEVMKKYKQVEEPERLLVDVNVPENIMEIYEEFAKKNNMDVMKRRETNVRRGATFVSLLRNKPSYCIICKRTHHSDNAYLIVTQNGISYACYRSNEKYYIDKNLEGVREVVKEEDDDEVDKIMAAIEKRLEKFR